MNEDLIKRIEALERENKSLKMVTSHWDEMQRTTMEALDKLTHLNSGLGDNLRRLEYVLEAAHIGWWDWNIPTGKVIVNATRAQMAGHSQEEFPDNYGEVIGNIHPDDRDNVIQTLQKHLNGELPVFDAEYRISDPDGAWKWVFDRGRVVERDILGKAIRMTGIMIEVHTARLREIEMKEALDKAEAASRDKSMFLAGMSHEIYTPLAGVIGMAEILKQSDLSSEQEEYLAAIVNSAANLMATFNEILDFLKIEAGKIELSSLAFSLSQIVEEEVLYFIENHYDKDIEVLSFFDPLIPDKIKGDPLRVRQILHIFLDNAVKFTESGHVSLHTWFKEWNDEYVTIQFRITDTGIGIQPEDIPKVFRSFARLKGANMEKYGGSGLGLAIASYLIREMGGDIQVESTVGVGTSFHFTLRLERYNGTGVTEDYFQCQNWRVLLLDENNIRRSILAEYLNRFECDVEEGYSIQEVVSRAGSNSLTGRFDLVIADEKTVGPEPVPFQVPVLWIGSQSGYAPPGVGEGDRKCLRWPVLPATLIDMMLKVKSGVIESQPCRKDSTKKAVHASRKKGLRILLAEDNLINQKVALVTLKKLGHLADLACNGIEALELFKTKDYDLVLMDIHMPELDGIECTRKIREIERKDPERKPVHICAITANPLKDDEDACMKAGMNSYIVKPFKLDELMPLMTRL